jgi:GWxTD domain-containing protein
MKKATLLLSLCGIVLALLPGPAGAGEKKAQLAKKYEQWLNDEVNYLITKEEKKAFLALPSDSERNAFIKSFWAKLDPLPLTPLNEFQEEHYRRLAQAKDKYGVHTDRGRIYILIGPPNDVEQELSAKYVFPCEVWNYYNLSLPSFPNSLRLIFYKPWGFGEMKLYSPLFDGLEYLVSQRHYDFKDTRISNLIREFMGVDFLRATESVAPGYDQLQSEKVLSTLRDPAVVSGLKRPSRPVVTTFVTYEKFPFDLVDTYTSDGRGSYYLDAGLQISPADLSFDKNQDKYYGREDVYVTLTDAGGNIVSQFNDQLTLELTEDEMQAQKGYALTYKFSGLVLPGEYGLKLLVRDFVSNRIGEKEVKVVLPPQGPVSGLVLGAKVENAAAPAPERSFVAAKKPFVFGPVRVFPRASRTFTRRETIFLYYEIYPGNSGGGTFDLAYSIRGADGREVKREAGMKEAAAGASAVPVERTFPAADLPDGSYELAVAVSGPGFEMPVEKKTPFTITSDALPPGEFSFENTMAPAREEASNNLGLQCLYRGQADRAETFFNMALNFAPDYVPAKINLAKCRVLSGDPEGALALLKPLVDGGLESAELFVLLANIHYGRKDLASSARWLEKAAEINVESVDVLNFLGSVYLEDGRKDKARETFAKSLKIKSDQPLVTSIIERIDN